MISISFIESEFSIVFLISNYIAFIRDSIIVKMFVQVVVLRSCDFLIACFLMLWVENKSFEIVAFELFLDENILLCFCWNRRSIKLLIMLFVFWFLRIRKKNRTIKIVVFELFRWLEYRIWRIHFAWMFWQTAQTFSIVLTFLIYEYCYE